jgi:hypothetical protein
MTGRIVVSRWRMRNDFMDKRGLVFVVVCFSMHLKLLRKIEILKNVHVWITNDGHDSSLYTTSLL